MIYQKNTQPAYYRRRRVRPRHTASTVWAIILVGLGLSGVVMVFHNRNTPTTSNDQNRFSNTAPETNTANPATQNTANNSSETVSISEEISNINKTIPNVSQYAEISKIKTDKKEVSLTFDAGSGTQSLQQILDTLQKYSVTVDFFITGKWMEKNPDLVNKIVAAGQKVHNHTYSHPHLTQITDAEIQNELSKTETIFNALTGASTKPFFRAPYGERSAHVLQIAAAEEYQSVYWTVDALDWQESEGMTSEQVISRVISKLAPGVIYLMHVGDTLTGNVLGNIIEQIQNKDYTIKPLEQLL